MEKQYDAFISYASEDKDTVAKPLEVALSGLGYSIWFDDISLKIGGSLSTSISKGILSSRYGIVIISSSFLDEKKKWTKKEVREMISHEGYSGEDMILPIWHKVTEKQVKESGLLLLDKIAATTDRGLSNVVAKIVNVLGNPINAANVSAESNLKRKEISRETAKHIYTIELYNEWHSEKIRESRIFVSAWSKGYHERQEVIPSLTVVENTGGEVEYHIFHLIHFYEKWALLSKNNVIDNELIIKLLGSYLAWYESNLIEPLASADEQNDDFKYLLGIIKSEVFNPEIHNYK